MGAIPADSVFLIGARVTLLPVGEAGYAVTEWHLEPGVKGPPVHVHHNTDEAFT